MSLEETHRELVSASGYLDDLVHGREALSVENIEDIQRILERIKIRYFDKPKKKKVLRAAVIRDDDGYCLSDGLYASLADAINSHGEDGVVRMAPDSYAVEVEE